MSLAQIRDTLVSFHLVLWDVVFLFQSCSSSLFYPCQTLLSLARQMAKWFVFDVSERPTGRIRTPSSSRMHEFSFHLLCLAVLGYAVGNILKRKI